MTITYGLLQLMHFNDLRIFFTIIHHLMIWYQLLLSYIKTLKSRILKTDYPIAMKFTGDMYRVLKSLYINSQVIL